MTGQAGHCAAKIVQVHKKSPLIDLIAYLYLRATDGFFQFFSLLYWKCWRKTASGLLAVGSKKKKKKMKWQRSRWKRERWPELSLMEQRTKSVSQERQKTVRSHDAYEPRTCGSLFWSFWYSLLAAENGFHGSFEVRFARLSVACLHTLFEEKSSRSASLRARHAWQLPAEHKDSRLTVTRALINWLLILAPQIRLWLWCSSKKVVVFQTLWSLDCDSKLAARRGESSMRLIFVPRLQLTMS